MMRMPGARPLRTPHAMDDGPGGHGDPPPPNHHNSFRDRHEPSNAQILDEVQRISRTVMRLDIALRGSLESNELGLIAKHEMHETAIVHLQHEQAAIRQEMQQPATDRRAMWREAMAGGIGGVIVFAVGAAIEWLKKGGS